MSSAVPGQSRDRRVPPSPRAAGPVVSSSGKARTGHNSDTRYSVRVANETVQTLV